MGEADRRSWSSQHCEPCGAIDRIERDDSNTRCAPRAFWPHGGLYPLSALRQARGLISLDVAVRYPAIGGILRAPAQSQHAEGRSTFPPQREILVRVAEGADEVSRPRSSCSGGDDPSHLVGLPATEGTDKTPFLQAGQRRTESEKLDQPSGGDPYVQALEAPQVRVPA